MRTSSRINVGLALALTGCALDSSARASNYTWNTNSGAFTSASSWTPAGVPGPFDVAIFRRGNVPVYGVFFGELLNPNSTVHPVIDRLRVGTNPLTFVGLHGSTLTVDSTNLTETARGVVIGELSTDIALLNSSMTDLSALYATLGSAAGSSGTLNVTAGAFNVTGASAQFALIVGLNGSGVLNVSDGHAVDVAGNTVLGRNAGSGGFANVSGAGSTWNNGGSLYVGYLGQGTFNIAGAGELQTDLPATLGDQVGAVGDVNVTGTGSAWNITPAPGGIGYELTIGRYGTGLLDIWSGGDVFLVGDSVLAHQAGSNANATIDGPGSQWIQQGELHIGYDGTGAVGITNGALLQTTYGYIGGYPGSSPQTAGTGTGSVNVSGANSHWNTTSGWISLGSGAPGTGGSGSLTIISAGHVSTTDVGIGNSFDSIGHVSVSGPNSLLQVTPGTPGSGADGAVYVGLQGDGTLNVSNGGEVDVASGGSSTIGWHANASGAAIVQGAQSKWDIFGPLIVGENGAATLDITNGGRVSTMATSYIGKNAGSIGEVTIDGASSMLLNAAHLMVGGAGTGTLSILNDGHLGGVAQLGFESGGVGEVNVDGPGSSWIVGGTGGWVPINIGVHGQGTLNITAGAHVSSSGHIGLNEDGVGVANVSGPGSIWAGGSCMVGFFGDGTLNITNGGEVANSNGFIGNVVGSTGHATVSGADSLWICTNNLVIGNEGDGMLTIASGGQINSAAAVIGDDATSSGTAVVSGSGSKWINNSTLTVGNFANGDLTVSEGGIVESVQVNVGVYGEIYGDGQIVGDVQSNGIIFPGDSAAAFGVPAPGTLHIDGDYVQGPTGDVFIDLASSSSYDQLLISGNVALDGILNVNLIDGFVPRPGDQFTIIASTAGTITGTIAQVNLPPGFQLNYTPTAVILEVPGPACPADISPMGGDGVVNVNDLLLVVGNWGATGANAADVNGDQVVNVNDLLAVVGAWGQCP